ncbi:MAG: UDP-N-acetylmuramate dehydrogenase [Actinomycetota bacterium]|nr:UDP-N-acetylmuramate dehydrogenase [Actinomycetota bacterium]
MRLAEHTTLRVGGNATASLVVTTEAALIEAVRQADVTGTPVLLLGGGSNLLVADEGFAGLVIQTKVRGIHHQDIGDLVFVTAACGEPWDSFVSVCLSSGAHGLEALSGIPGDVGATPIQNVGAYGVEVGNLIASVRVWDREVQEQRDLSPQECGFTYRGSIFKEHPDRWVVLAVTFALARTGLSRIMYDQLAELLDLDVGDTALPSRIRESVVRLRRSKGMVLDETDYDTWSAGSFFTNPIVSPEVERTLPADCPRYPASSGAKLSAAWLIQHAGVDPGFGLNERARISTKHSLALTNRGEANAADILELAKHVRERVLSTFAIELKPEVRLVGCTLD